MPGDSDAIDAPEAVGAVERTGDLPAWSPDWRGGTDEGLAVETRGLTKRYGERVALKSAKSRLQEWSQRVHRQKPRYELLETSGPPHEQRFRVAVLLNGQRLAEGTGLSRQRAEEHAAGQAMQHVHRRAAVDEEPA